MFQVTDPGARALWGLIIILLVGLMVGSWLNRRRSKAIGLWLQAGLAQLGGRTSWRWVRGMSSGAQITIEGANRPFARLEIGYYLLTREFPLLWGIERLRGQRDLLTVRGDLREPPRGEVEIVPAAGDLRRKLADQPGADAFWWEDGPAGLAIAGRGEGARAAAGKLRPFVEQYGPHIRRLSLRPRRPHLMLFLNLAGPEAAPASELIRTLRKALD